MAVPTVEMLGGLKMPVVGIGTWQSSDEQELEDALNAAYDSGYRHIDTAFAYRNEHVIGRVIQQWISSGKCKREDLFVTTKLPPSGVNPNRVLKYLTKSLHDLQLDYVDLYLIHFPVCFNERSPRSSGDTGPILCEPTDIVEVWKKMEKMVDAGHTKSIGLSNFNTEQIDRIISNARIIPACLQVELHVFLPQWELVKYAQDNRIVVVAYSPLANPGINKFLEKLGRPHRKLPTMFTDPNVKALSEKYKKTPAQIMLKFLLERSIVVIPKSVSVARVKENIDLFDFHLTEEDMKLLKKSEVGENARVVDFVSVAPSAGDHPEFPFPRRKHQKFANLFR